MSKNEIFDKAKYHYEGNFPLGLPLDQAYVHTGFFVCWLALNRKISSELIRDFAQEISELQTRFSLPCSLYRSMGGVFDQLSVDAAGDRFTRAYFDFEHGQYISDYKAVFAVKDRDFYSVEDTWPNYDLLASRIGSRCLGVEASAHY